MMVVFCKNRSLSARDIVFVCPMLYSCIQTLTDLLFIVEKSNYLERGILWIKKSWSVGCIIISNVMKSI